MKKINCPIDMQKEIQRNEIILYNEGYDNYLSSFQNKPLIQEEIEYKILMLDFIAIVKKVSINVSIDCCSEVVKFYKIPKEERKTILYVNILQKILDEAAQCNYQEVKNIFNNYKANYILEIKRIKCKQTELFNLFKEYEENINLIIIEQGNQAEEEEAIEVEMTKIVKLEKQEEIINSNPIGLLDLKHEIRNYIEVVHIEEIDDMEIISDLQEMQDKCNKQQEENNRITNLAKQAQNEMHKQHSQAVSAIKAMRDKQRKEEELILQDTKTKYAQEIERFVRNIIYIEYLQKEAEKGVVYHIKEARDDNAEINKELNIESTQNTMMCKKYQDLIINAARVNLDKSNRYFAQFEKKIQTIIITSGITKKLQQIRRKLHKIHKMHDTQSIKDIRSIQSDQQKQLFQIEKDIQGIKLMVIKQRTDIEKATLELHDKNKSAINAKQNKCQIINILSKQEELFESAKKYIQRINTDAEFHIQYTENMIISKPALEKAIQSIRRIRDYYIKKSEEELECIKNKYNQGEDITYQDVEINIKAIQELCNKQDEEFRKIIAENDDYARNLYTARKK